MLVQNVMTNSPFACQANDSANEAARIMWEQDCGAVPVLSGDGSLIGIVTDRDICMAAYFRGAPLKSIPISEIMSTELCTCQPTDDVSTAERLMREHQVNRLPVVQDETTLVGMLSLCDLTQGIKRANGKAGTEGRELLETVTAIREPRHANVAQARTPLSSM